MMIGNPLKFSSLSVYLWAPSGNSASAAFMASRMSDITSCWFQPKSNSSTMPAWFSEAIPRILSRPSRLESSLSMGLMSSFSLSAAEIPG